MTRTTILSILTICLVLQAVTHGAREPEPQIEAFAPTQIHELEAAAKAGALARMRLGFTPNVLVDQSGFDATYYGINLAIDEVTQQVVGAVTMTARSRAAGFGSPTLNLLDGLTVDSVTSPGQPVSWSHVGGFVYVTLPNAYDIGEEFTITIYYRGHPVEGGFQGFEFGAHAGYPMISTLSEPYMAQSWWPCKDTPSDKADSVDMRVTVNSAFYAVSNGLLRDSIDNGNGTTTYYWHESYPITTYLVSLAITNYSRFSRWYHYGADSMPVMFFSYPESFATAQTSWPIVVTQIGALAGYFGPYPFINEKYGIAHFTWGGAMEHQTASSHTGSAGGFGQYLTVHELSHQWWGDMITCRDWHHIWLNEGFASYSEALWAEYNGGATAYRSYMGGMEYWGAGRIYIDDTNDVWNIFSARVYDKGAWVLHMLRGVIGDEAFFQTFQAYYADPRYQYKDAVTEDFRDVAEAVSGQDLNWFFEDWIYGYYFPKYYRSYVSRPRADGKHDLFVRLRQAQATTPQVFRMPVDLVLSSGGVPDTVRVWNDERDQDYWFVLDNPGSVTQVDPLNWVLNELYTELYGLQLVSDSLVTANQYTPYFDSLIAACNDLGATITFSVVGGALPEGLALEPATGRITGTPVDTADALVTLRVSVPGYPDDDKVLTIAVQETPYMAGDQNGDWILNIEDIVGLIGYIFRLGPPPMPLNAADPSGDCRADIVDVVTLINSVLRNGQPPLPGCLQ